MPQNPYFSRKLIGFDGGGLVLASATLRCTSKPHSDYAVGFCFFVAPWVRTPMQRGRRRTARSIALQCDGIANALRERQARSP